MWYCDKSRWWRFGLIWCRHITSFIIGCRLCYTELESRSGVYSESKSEPGVWFDKLRKICEKHNGCKEWFTYLFVLILKNTNGLYIFLMLPIFRFMMSYLGVESLSEELSFIFLLRLCSSFSCWGIVHGKSFCVMFSNRDPTLRRSGVANLFIRNLEPNIVTKSLRQMFFGFGTILFLPLI